MSTKKPKSPAAQDFDRTVRGQMAQMTGGLALSAFSAAWMDWMTHLAQSPGRQMELQQQALGRAADNGSFALRALAGEALSPAEGFDGTAEKRYADPAWSQFPFNVLARAHQNGQALLKDSVRGGHRRIRARPGRGGDARQGRLPQPS
jgi:polyhydroxyalkanoate synthase